MNTVQRTIQKYNSIEERRKNLDIANSDFNIDSRTFNDNLYLKTTRLLYTGRNILKKILSPEEFKNFEKGTGIFSRQLKLDWLRMDITEVSFNIWKTNPSRADLILTGVDYKGSYLAYSISSEVLNYSIRDFAKLVRSKTKKSLLKTWEIEIQIAEEIISKNKNKIENSSF